MRRERDQIVLALSKTDAARAVGVSVDFFDEHIRPEVRCVARGRLLLFPVRELEAWLDRNAGPSCQTGSQELSRVGIAA